jgi:hypothetical protein
MRYLKVTPYVVIGGRSVALCKSTYNALHFSQTFECAVIYTCNKVWNYCKAVTLSEEAFSDIYCNTKMMRSVSEYVVLVLLVTVQLNTSHKIHLRVVWSANLSGQACGSKQMRGTEE